MEKLKKLLRSQHGLYNRKKLEIEKAILKLPKGAVKKVNVRGNIYYYLCYRVGKTVKNDYLGKSKPIKLIKQITKRRKLIIELREVKKALKMIRSVRPKII